MSAGLTSKTSWGIFWSLVERGGSQLVQLVVSVTLARILLPEDFGLMAILAVFIAVSNQLVNAGFSQALIQKQDTTYLDECSVFYCNTFLSLLVAASLYFAAPMIADFYDNPILTPLGRVLSLNIVLGALGAIHTTLLTKQLNFVVQLKVGLLSTILSGVIGIAMAVRGYGVWSLAALAISATVGRTILLWSVHNWRPGRTFSMTSLRGMFPYGSRLLLSSLLNTVFENLYALVIGKYYSATDLGYYSRAEHLQKVPVLSLTAAVGRVTFPAFSSIQEDKARLKRGVRRSITSLALLNFPMMIGLAVVAKPLILLLLTEKWLPSVLFFQLFCVLGLLYPLHAANLGVLKALGRSDLFLRLELIKWVPLIAALLITYRWGVAAIIGGAIVVSCVGYYINAYYTNKLIRYSILEQLKDISPYLFVALVMGVCVYFVQYLTSPNLIAQLAIQTILGITLYVGICRLLGLRAFMEVWVIFERNLSKLRKTD